MSKLPISVAHRSQCRVDRSHQLLKLDIPASNSEGVDEILSCERCVLYRGPEIELKSSIKRLVVFLVVLPQRAVVQVQVSDDPGHYLVVRIAAERVVGSRGAGVNVVLGVTGQSTGHALSAGDKQCGVAGLSGRADELAVCTALDWIS